MTENEIIFLCFMAAIAAAITPWRLLMDRPLLVFMIGLMLVGIFGIIATCTQADNIYVNDRQAEQFSCRDVGEDIRCTVNYSPTTTPPPDPDPDPVPPPSTSCPSTGNISAIMPKVDLRVGNPEVEVNASPYVVGELIGAARSGSIQFGTRPGANNSLKAAVISSCPSTNDTYFIPGCYGNGSQSVVIRFNSNNCRLQAGKRYYLIYGYSNCRGDCNAVRAVY